MLTSANRPGREAFLAVSTMLTDGPLARAFIFVAGLLGATFLVLQLTEAPPDAYFYFAALYAAISSYNVFRDLLTQRSRESGRDPKARLHHWALNVMGFLLAALVLVSGAPRGPVDPSEPSDWVRLAHPMITVLVTAGWAYWLVRFRARRTPSPDGIDLDTANDATEGISPMRSLVVILTGSGPSVLFVLLVTNAPTDAYYFSAVLCALVSVFSLVSFAARVVLDFRLHDDVEPPPELLLSFSSYGGTALSVWWLAPDGPVRLSDPSNWVRIAVAVITVFGTALGAYWLWRVQQRNRRNKRLALGDVESTIRTLLEGGEEVPNDELSFAVWEKLKERYGKKIAEKLRPEINAAITSMHERGLVAYGPTGRGLVNANPAAPRPPGTHAPLVPVPSERAPASRMARTAVPVLTVIAILAAATGGSVFVDNDLARRVSTMVATATAMLAMFIALKMYFEYFNLRHELSALRHNYERAATGPPSPDVPRLQVVRNEGPDS